MFPSRQYLSEEYVVAFEVHFIRENLLRQKETVQSRRCLDLFAIDQFQIVVSVENEPILVETAEIGFVVTRC